MRELRRKGVTSIGQVKVAGRSRGDGRPAYLNNGELPGGLHLQVECRSSCSLKSGRAGLILESSNRRRRRPGMLAGGLWANFAHKSSGIDILVCMPVPVKPGVASTL